jgi:hypothetical protein
LQRLDSGNPVEGNKTNHGKPYRGAMTHLNDEINELALDLAWSLWAELGVDGRGRRHDWQAVDLEPLIIFTAYIGNLDSRLRANSMDWCIANVRFASAFRLRNLAQNASAAMGEAFGRYAATVKAHSHVPWPSLGDPLAIWTSERIGEPDLRRPSLIQLRLRALVGVSARAEILKLMLADPERGQVASTLAQAAAYSKGSVSQALDLLTMAGIVQVQPTANRLVYRLSRPTVLIDVMQWLPATFPDWWPIFRVTEAIVELAHERSTTPLSRAADVQKTLGRINQDLQRLGIADQVPRGAGPASVTEFEHWALTFLQDQSGRGEAMPAARDVTYTVHHLSFGGWMATVSQRGRQPRRLEVGDHAPKVQRQDWAAFQEHLAQAQPARPAADPRSDQMEGERPLELAMAIFHDVLARAGSKVKDQNAADAVVRLIGGEFAIELLRPMRPGQEATFTAEFMRRWYENRRQRFVSTG